MKLYIDFGGTNFRYQIDKNKIYSLNSKTIDLLAFLESILKKHTQIDTINISFAGHVNAGKIISSPNINIETMDIKSYIKNKYNISLNIQNDLNCAALAEQNYFKKKSLGVFYIGTGFGSAFIDKNSLILGARNQSGEIGHIPFKKTPFICGCGRNDCLELSASGSALEKWCEYYKFDKRYNQLDTLSSYDNENAKKIVKNFYEALAFAFHTTLNLFDFDTLVLGGGLGKNIKIKEFLENEFKTCAFKKENLNIELSKLKEGSLEGTKYL